MLLDTALNLSRFFIYISTIILLISSIKTKNTKICGNNTVISLVFMLYLFVNLFIIPSFAGLDTGWEYLLYLAGSFVATIVLIITIIINLVKRKKQKNNNTNSTITKENFLTRNYIVIMLIVPLCLITNAWMYELSILNNCKMVLCYNYQNGFVISVNTNYAVSPNSCTKFGIDKSFKYGHERSIKHYIYHFIEDENNTYILKGFKSDSSISTIDTSIANTIINDNHYEKNKYANDLLHENPSMKHNAYITTFEGTKYYIVTHLINDDNSGGGTVLGEAIFYGTKFIDNIEPSGNIKSASLYYN